MTSIVVTLFDHPDKANEAMIALEKAEFTRANMECIESDPESQSFFKRLFTTDGGEEMAAEHTMEYLTEMGIPDDEAKAYADQVRKGNSLLIVRCANEQEAQRATELLRQYPFEDTATEKRDIAEEPKEKQAAKAEPHARKGDARKSDGEKIEAVEEELAVGKREVQTGGVRAEKEVVEEDVEEEVILQHEDVNVERRQVDRPLEEGEGAFDKEETIEVSESREEAVVSKEPRVREEVVINKDVEEHPETVKETLRHEEINIDEFGAKAESRYEQFEPDLQRHYDENLAHRGHDFDEHARGYRYGMALAESSEYRGHDWENVEPVAARQWESQSDDIGPWENFKNSVRHGWNKIRGEEGTERDRPGRA